MILLWVALIFGVGVLLFVFHSLRKRNRQESERVIEVEVKKKKIDQLDEKFTEFYRELRRLVGE